MAHVIGVKVGLTLLHVLSTPYEESQSHSNATDLMSQSPALLMCGRGVFYFVNFYVMPLISPE